MGCVCYEAVGSCGSQSLISTLAIMLPQTPACVEYPHLLTEYPFDDAFN